MHGAEIDAAVRVVHARTPAGDAKTIVWVCALSAAVYPWVLDVFHWAITPAAATAQNAAASLWSLALAALMLAVAFAQPLACLMMAGRPGRAGAGNIVRARRFAFMAMAAPTAYVFFGVITYMAGSRIADTWIWTPAWLLLGAWAARPCQATAAVSTVSSARLRVAHGIGGTITAIFVLFHVANHLFGLVGPQMHALVMEIGRTVYRYPAVEVLLVIVMLFQIVSGLRLMWTWSEVSSDRYRIFQLASGLFMSVFIIGHMNSVFIFARTFLGIPTDWAFAAGLPVGLIADAWNIRLLPHYALGVFFVLAHLFSGLRVLMLAHGARQSHANTVWWIGAGLSVVVSLAVMLGLTGFRV